jgi:hypothetical protein
MLLMTFFLAVAVGNVGLGYMTYVVWRRRMVGAKAISLGIPFLRGRG